MHTRVMVDMQEETAVTQMRHALSFSLLIIACCFSDFKEH